MVCWRCSHQDRHALYSNPTLDIKHRISLFQTLVMTGLMFDVAIWPELSNQEKKLFEDSVHGLYNSLSLAIWNEEVYSWRQDRMRARLGLPHPTVLASVARLRHLHHLCLQADDYISGFLRLDMQWLQLVRKDIEWLRIQIPRRLPQTDPHDDWSPWMEDITVWPSMEEQSQGGSTTLGSSGHQEERLEYLASTISGTSPGRRTLEI